MVFPNKKVIVDDLCYVYGRIFIEEYYYGDTDVKYPRIV